MVFTLAEVFVSSVCDHQQRFQILQGLDSTFHKWNTSYWDRFASGQTDPAFNLSSVERIPLADWHRDTVVQLSQMANVLGYHESCKYIAQTTCIDFVAILSLVPVTHWNKRRLTSTSYCASVGRLLISLRRSEKPILCDERTSWKSKWATAMPKCNCKRGYKRDKNEYLCHPVCHRCSFSSLSSSHHIHNLKF